MYSTVINICTYCEKIRNILMHRNRNSAAYPKKCFSLGMWYKFSFIKGI